MIIGIGHDLAQITRFQKLLASKSRDAFLKRILTSSEREAVAQYSAEERQAQYIAGRFAAKEAISKAFGCGIGTKLGFQDMTIDRLSSGQPQCIVSREALDKLGFAEGTISIHLSISHDGEYASAFAVIEK